MWTRFMDMLSGGVGKEKWDYIYIEAAEDEAKVIFYNRFGHNPDRVSCTCCGNDYSISSERTLQRLTACDRNCRNLEPPRGKNGLYKEVKNKWWKEHYYLEPEEEAEAIRRGWSIDTRWSKGKHIPLAKYVKSEGIFVLYSKDIKAKERCGELPEQGYVWVD